jgi:hypothetical protein
MRRAVLLWLTVMEVTLILTSGIALAAVVQCVPGQLCLGTSSSDQITGTDGSDNINAFSGRDDVLAQGGSDRVRGVAPMSL